MGWSLNRIAFIVWSLVTFSGALLPAFIIANIGRIVDQIASGISAGRDFGDIRNLILILGSLWVLQNLYSVAGQFSHRQLLNHFAPKMHKRLIEALDGVPVRRFDDPHFNDLTSKARGASESVTYFTMYVINFASQVFGTAGIFFVAARIRWYFPIVALLIMAVRFVVDQSAGRQVMDTWNEIVPLERRKKHFFYVNSKRNPAKDIRMLQLTDWFAALRSRYAKELRDKMHRIHVLRNRGQYLSVALDVVFSALAIVPSLIMVYARQMTIGELTMTWQISERLSGQMNSLATNFFGVYQHLADLKILKELLELCMSDERLPMIKALGHESVSNDPEPKSDNVFELDNVSFVYHGEHEALHGITLSIPRGQVVALCGENGAGKSTLVKIMLGLYSPTSGEIRFEGHPYGELERDYLLRKIGVAFQEPDRYNYTIRECIGFGNLAKLDDLAAVKEAARKGGAAEFIRDVAHDNYEANLGRMLYRDGLELSGGQWQRLGVSRAHIGDRDVLVMDEPASQLDPIAEYEQFKAVREMVHGRTALMRRSCEEKASTLRCSRVRPSGMQTLRQTETRLATRCQRRGRPLATGSAAMCPAETFTAAPCLTEMRRTARGPAVMRPAAPCLAEMCRTARRPTEMRPATPCSTARRSARRRSEMVTRADMYERKITFREVLESVKLAFKYLATAATPRERVLLASLYLLAAAAPVALSLLNRYIVDVASQLYDSADRGLLFKAIWIMIGALLATTSIGVLSLLLNPLRDTVFRTASDKVEEDMAKKCGTMRLERFHDTQFLDHVQFLMGTILGQMTGMTTRIAGIAMSVASSVGVLALVAGTAREVGLVMVAGIIPCVLLYRKQANIQYEEAYWEMPNYKRINYALGMFTDRVHVNEMRFYGLGDTIYQKWQNSTDAIVAERQALNLSLSFYNLLALVSMDIAMTVSLGIIAWRVFIGDASVGVFTMMATAIQNFNETLRHISHELVYVGYGAKYVSDFRHLLQDVESEVMLKGDEPVPDEVEIEFKDVHFRYPGTDRDAIDDVSVKFRQGEKVAIVGENGSGKSTFALLLTGLFAAQSGTVEFNGEELMSCLGKARKSISCVHQEHGQYQLSVKDFIRIGDLYRDVSDEEIAQAARTAGADEFIRKLPNGYDTNLGTLGEIGIDISGGEWQRLLLARALIRKGARVMVLDEPTAALDPKAEARLYSEFSQLTGDRTTILISHRLGITRVVDRILVFDKGRIVEDGNHAQLMKLNGLYARMYRAQAQWYV